MENTIEKIYQKKTQLEHILLRPDSYVGSVDHMNAQMWVLNTDGSKFQNRTIEFVPALYQIFDEILVNAADNYQRDKRMNKMQVQINQAGNTISIWNNGKGIPVQKHKQHNIYVPELIFGHLLTSSNYDDNVKQTTGGRNGYGAKLTNIFSKRFTVQTAENGKMFQMTWRDNMSVTEEPIIQSTTEKDFTCITFEPDLRKFKMKSLDSDMVDLMRKRVYDMAGVIGGNMKVYLNKQLVPLSGFSSYVDMYLLSTGASKETIIKITEKDTNNDRWEIIASISDGQFQQVSFANSICTSKGGTHVNYITDQIVDKLMESLKGKKGSKDLNIKPVQVRTHLSVFVNALIENPTFDSQTKDTLTLKHTNFGSTCKVSEKFIKNLKGSGIMDHVLLQAQAKEQAKMAKTLSGKKQSRLLGVNKLEDANDAGTRNAQSCTLIITEGDSAKALAMSGIEVVGRDQYGVFPLKGKMLNVRQSTAKQAMDNQEIKNLCQIMGFQLGKDYDSVKSLRYGSIMIMTDQDHDGSHIKGLFLNFIQHFWPSLYQMQGFLKEFVTPIIQVTNKSNVISFFTIQDYKAWLERTQDADQWQTQYYKGLGTSTDKQAQEYFKNLLKHEIRFKYIDNEDNDCIDLAFNQKLADQRKQWLSNYNPNIFVDHREKILRYQDFVHKELIHFSITDNARSIPSVCDGLKPGQRKILFACFQRNLQDEIQVAQLAGYVAEHSAYHHGEISLTQTIVGMAQNFVGANNINYLLPLGQYGSRNMGGQDAASARYIHTNMNKITRCLFPESDDHVLNYLDDDGQKVEPEYYIPILPTVLINGADGIGTGWSTNVPCYNPREIVEALERRLGGDSFTELLPWYKGYTGDISFSDKGGIAIRSAYNIVDEDTIELTEIPLKKWTRDYKNFLQEKLQVNEKQGYLEPEIEDIKEYHAGNRVHFVIKMAPGVLTRITQADGGVEKFFKLNSSLQTSNMVLFDPSGKIHQYDSVAQILETFFQLRREFYEKRKDYLISRLEKEVVILQNQKRFILAVINDELKIRNVKKQLIVDDLIKKGFRMMKDMPKVLSTKLSNQPQHNENEDEEKGDESSGSNLKEYNYLLSLPLWSLTFEKVEELKRQLAQKEEEMKELRDTTKEDMWRKDLANFIQVLDEVEDEQQNEMKERLTKAQVKGGKVSISSKRAQKPAKKTSNHDFSDEEEFGGAQSDSGGDNGSDSDNWGGNKKKKANSKKSIVEDSLRLSQVQPSMSSKVNRQVGPPPVVVPSLSQGSKPRGSKQEVATENKMEDEGARISNSQTVEPKQTNEISSLSQTILKYLTPAASQQTSNGFDQVINTQQSGDSGVGMLSLQERLRIKASQGQLKVYENSYQEAKNSPFGKLGGTGGSEKDTGSSAAKKNPQKQSVIDDFCDYMLKDSNDMLGKRKRTNNQIIDDEEDDYENQSKNNKSDAGSKENVDEEEDYEILKKSTQTNQEKKNTSDSSNLNTKATSAVVKKRQSKKIESEDEDMFKGDTNFQGQVDKDDESFQFGNSDKENSDQNKNGGRGSQKQKGKNGSSQPKTKSNQAKKPRTKKIVDSDNSQDDESEDQFKLNSDSQKGAPKKTTKPRAKKNGDTNSSSGILTQRSGKSQQTTSSSSAPKQNQRRITQKKINSDDDDDEQLDDLSLSESDMEKDEFNPSQSMVASRAKRNISRKVYIDSDDGDGKDDEEFDI